MNEVFVTPAAHLAPARFRLDMSSGMSYRKRGLKRENERDRSRAPAPASYKPITVRVTIFFRNGSPRAKIGHWFR